MRVTKLNSSKEVLLKINKYRLDWRNDGNSSLEIKFRDLIYPFWKHYIVLFQCTVPGSLLKVDFLNCSKRLAVEINGPQHNKYIRHFHRSRNGYLNSLKRDISKFKWLEDNHIQILELQGEDLDLFSVDYIFKKFGINIV